jgi:hypothetical protein
MTSCNKVQTRDLARCMLINAQILLTVSPVATCVTRRHKRPYGTLGRDVATDDSTHGTRSHVPARRPGCSVLVPPTVSCYAVRLTYAPATRGAFVIRAGGVSIRCDTHPSPARIPAESRQTGKSCRSRALRAGTCSVDAAKMPGTGGAASAASAGGKKGAAYSGTPPLEPRSPLLACVLLPVSAAIIVFMLHDVISRPDFSEKRPWISKPSQKNGRS